MLTLNFMIIFKSFAGLFFLQLQVVYFNRSVKCSDKTYWDEYLQERIQHNNICNIETLDQLNQYEFLGKYAYHKPFILKNVKQNKNFIYYTSKEYLLQNYGNKIIRLSSANTYSYQKKDVTLGYYFEKLMGAQSITALGNETYYWFGDNNYTEWAGLFDEYLPPSLHLPNMVPAYSFGIAATGTGVPFHFHGPGFAEVIHGSKLWLLYPPEYTPVFHPNKTTLQWYKEDYPHLAPTQRPMECAIRPGEIIYFPNHWWHATLNLETSAFISTFLA